ncbi:hypothetical protein [Tichowtungia aerotolerans]|uniref:Glycoside hydrolase family 42 N-terminal domain-containing protein n=1 Tax=Tichowtungia aerotolerans TaxID=2697043 RepID=A0A6P1MDF7_9BACT|nr:hypothetical protein [Tichowtungia aerotolerans]QHI69135.1 hypothetical protein GT409_06625 [Tichowtungia aerotolerans]
MHTTRKNLLLTITLIAGTAFSEVSNAWKLPACASQTSETVTIEPQKSKKNTIATQRIPGPFKAGELLRFSADAELTDIRDEKGNSKLKPFDLNLEPRNVCLTLAQIDPAGRVLCAPGSERALGTKTIHLELETVVQENVKEIELRLLATFVTGKVTFTNFRFEKAEAAPLQKLPEAKVVKNENGACEWTINGEKQPLAMYFGNNQFNRDDRILEEMEKAVAAGVPVLSFNLYLPAMVSNSETLKMIERFMKPFPDAYFIPRIWLGPGSEWQQSFPAEMMKYADGQIGGYASPCSEPWKNFTDHNLRELVNLIRRSPYAQQCVGFKLTYYQTGEWIFWDPHRAAGFEEPVRRAFGKPVPTEEERNAAVEGLFRDPEIQQRVIEFSKFYNTVNADNIIRFSRSVKEAADGPTLTATFYGYLFELAWHEKWLQQGGHLGLEKLYRSPAVDIVGAPYSYNPIGRGFGLPVDLHGPFDGANAFGKLVMTEEDTFTHLAEDVPEVVKGYAPGYASRTKNMDETLAVLHRDLGVVTAHNQILLWQNLFSEGRFNNNQIWDMYKPYLAWMKQRQAPAFTPQVAVLADPDAVTMLKTDAYGLTERWLYQNRFFLNRVDTTIGYFQTSEIDQLSDRTRCIILLTPWSLTEDQKAVLKSRFMKDGRTIIFCGTTALDTIELKKQEGAIMPESRLDNGSLFGRRQFGRQNEQPVAPTFAVADHKADTFAHYTATGEPSCATKKMRGWTAAFLGSPGMPALQWRKLFKEAGCHLYLADESFSTDFDRPDFIQAGGNFLMVQSATGGEKSIRLPKEASKIYRFDHTEPKLMKTNSDTLHISLQPGVPAFLVTE